MGANLGAAAGGDSAYDLPRPFGRGNLIGGEVRGAHAESLEHPVEPGQLANVLDGDPFARGLPVVFLGIDRDAQRDRL